MPKGRYKIMREYMPKVGKLGLDMMLRTCTVQANLDFASEADMVEEVPHLLALQPLATALFANSPFIEGKPSGFMCYRATSGPTPIPTARGMLRLRVRGRFRLRALCRLRARRADVLRLSRRPLHRRARASSFRDFMEGKLPALPGELPSMKTGPTTLPPSSPRCG